MDHNIQKVAVLGAGTMGAQIAGHFSNAGIPSLLFDINSDLAKKGVEVLSKLKPAPLYKPKNAELITACTYDNDLDKLKDVDLVIEAVAENLEIKHTVYKNIVPHLKESVIMSSNTSGIPLAELIKVLPDNLKSRFLITHFFNPPRYMRLLELVKGPQTDNDIYNTLHGIDISIDGSEIYVSGRRDGYLHTIQSNNGDLLYSTPLSNNLSMVMSGGVATNYGSYVTQGDINFDGNVDITDFPVPDAPPR